MKHFKRILCVFVCAVFSVSVLASQAAPVFAADGSAKLKDFTVMIYMCGSDLESGSAAASFDIKEMIAGYKEGGVNVIIQTGGTKKWYYKGISSKKNQRYKLTENGLKLIDNSLGQLDMGKSSTLADFIKYGKKNYPAKRYALIMWDHGGGTIAGFGSDENFKGSKLTLTEMNSAFKKGGVYFDFIGFDACLMATFEMALIASKYANYMIAAESPLSGSGWYYKNWIKTLCGDPSVSVPKLGKEIVDDSLEKCLEYDRYADTDLGVVDLKKVRKNVLPALDTFAKKNYAMLSNEKFHIVANYRSKLDIYSSYEIVDMKSYASCYDKEKSVSASAKALKKQLSSAVIYHDTTAGNDNLNGLSIFFPFEDLENVDKLAAIYKAAGCSTYFMDFLKYYANIMVGGQVYYNEQRKISSSSKTKKYASYSWYDPDKFYKKSYYSDFYLDSNDLKPKRKGSSYVIPLTERQKYGIKNCSLQLLWLYDRKSIVDLGNDNVIGFDKNNDLLIDFDEQWVALNGKIVPSYYFSSTSYSSGYETHMSAVPCLYNGKEAMLILLWDNEENTYPDGGIVYGILPVYDDDTPAKGIISLKDDDVIQPTYDFYSYDLDLIKSAPLDSKKITVKDGLEVTYEDISQLGKCVAYGLITDIFGNMYSTENIYF